MQVFQAGGLAGPTLTKVQKLHKDGSLIGRVETRSSRDVLYSKKGVPEAATVILPGIPIHLIGETFQSRTWSDSPFILIDRTQIHCICGSLENMNSYNYSNMWQLNLSQLDNPSQEELNQISKKLFGNYKKTKSGEELNQKIYEVHSRETLKIPDESTKYTLYKFLMEKSETFEEDIKNQSSEELEELIESWKILVKNASPNEMNDVQKEQCLYSLNKLKGREFRHQIEYFEKCSKNIKPKIKYSKYNKLKHNEVIISTKKGADRIVGIGLRMNIKALKITKDVIRNLDRSEVPLCFYDSDTGDIEVVKLDDFNDDQNKYIDELIKGIRGEPSDFDEISDTFPILKKQFYEGQLLFKIEKIIEVDRIDSSIKLKIIDSDISKLINENQEIIKNIVKTLIQGIECKNELINQYAINGLIQLMENDEIKKFINSNVELKGKFNELFQKLSNELIEGGFSQRYQVSCILNQLLTNEDIFNSLINEKEISITLVTRICNVYKTDKDLMEKLLEPLAALITNCEWYMNEEQDKAAINLAVQTIRNQLTSDNFDCVQYTIKSLNKKIIKLIGMDKKYLKVFVKNLLILSDEDSWFWYNNKGNFYRQKVDQLLYNLMFSPEYSDLRICDEIKKDDELIKKFIKSLPSSGNYIAVKLDYILENQNFVEDILKDKKQVILKDKEQIRSVTMFLQSQMNPYQEESVKKRALEILNGLIEYPDIIECMTENDKQFKKWIEVILNNENIRKQIVLFHYESIIDFLDKLRTEEALELKLKLQETRTNMSCKIDHLDKLGTKEDLELKLKSQETRSNMSCKYLILRLMKCLKKNRLVILK